MRRYQVLFVCIGNACRSQMAEAFARRYGSDLLIAKSAGLAPCEMVSPVTVELMREKDIHLDGASPKGLAATGVNFDLIVNMSGYPLPPGVSAEVRTWQVDDPIWLSEEQHRQVRDRIEALVLGLVRELREHRALGGRRNVPLARGAI